MREDACFLSHLAGIRRTPQNPPLFGWPDEWMGGVSAHRLAGAAVGGVGEGIPPAGLPEAVPCRVAAVTARASPREKRFARTLSCSGGMGGERGWDEGKSRIKLASIPIPRRVCHDWEGGVGGRMRDNLGFLASLGGPGPAPQEPA